ncbi:OPT-domain-containing protein [Tilletiaria anomala UBC 951]|uniref:OPT-domain-containing protein n=1 Tax=Tilletiaria anomala (strain ATCC 24038 / CBS 436.72 / UBC 951) TaxID=1037660 RepID=A0A066VNV8_TILAU|nr:OPT-domain-containing protein [Tilletiaria anomala UBC 951]KDN40265.1 OPT-domain-containing protein [Tilletiaria anomala UBC 951]
MDYSHSNDIDYGRPTTSSGRPGTSSGRPHTSRPGTSSGGGAAAPRFGSFANGDAAVGGANASSSHNAPAFGTGAHTPNASSSRPGTGRKRRGTGSRAGTANTLQGMELNPYGMDDLYEDDEWDDEESDDGDVFAFKPPELGPSAAIMDDLVWEQHRQVGNMPASSAVASAPSTIAASAPASASAPGGVTMQSSRAGDHRALPHQAVQIGEELDAAEEEEEEEMFYYDEKTGAVYDSEGRLVETNPDFDASQVLAIAASSVEGNSVPPVPLLPATVPPPLSSAPLSKTGASHASFTPTAASAAAAQVSNGIVPSRSTSSSSQTPKRNSSAISLKAFKRLSARDLGYTASGARAPDEENGPIVRVLSPTPGSNGVGGGNYPRKSQPPAFSPPHAMEMLELDRRYIASGDTFIDIDEAPEMRVRKRTSSASRHAAVAAAATMGAGSSTESHRTDVLHASTSRTAFESFFSTKQPYKGAYTMNEYEKAFNSGAIANGKDWQEQQQQQQQQGEPIEVGSRGLRLIALEVETEEDSPFPEVRASVSNVDDPSMPVSTFRLWFLGLFICSIAGAANTVFSFRYPAPQISPLLILLLVYPLGKLMAVTMPYRAVQLPRWLGGRSFTLNSGFFNVKEHSTITQMANVAVGQAFALNAVIAQDSPIFYNDPRPVGFAIMFTLSSVLFSFGLAGMCKRLLVWPASMIWPQNLTVCTILNTLHAEEDGQDGRMTRFKYFFIVLVAAFCWNFVPNFLFTGLSVFNWVCWIAPQNKYVNTLFGASNGLGMSVLTFDWNQISYVGSPMITPYWAVCNLMVGFVLLVWIVFPTLYFTNTWYFGFLPILGGSAYDRFGKPYKIRSVLDGMLLNKELYESYSPLYIPVNYFVVYWCGLALATAMIVHTALYHGKGIMQGLRNKKVENDDIHATMMRRYKEVPDWWYGMLLLISFVMALIAIEVYKIGLPVWALMLSLLIPTIYIIPSGFIFAMTGQIINTNLVTELISGYALPSHPFPNLVFKAYSLAGISSGLTFVQDLKLGHYMKVPPRISFAAQVTATVWVIFVQIGMKMFMFSKVSLLCSSAEPHNFTCPIASVYYTSSIVWGIIGPRRMFGPDSLYSSMYYALLVGALAPLPFWFLARKYKDSKWKFVSSPLILAGSAYVPPGSGLNYTSFFLVAFIFQYIARRRFFSWWSKYNFVTSSAMDMGTALSMLFVFFALTLPKGGAIALNWWGNNVPFETADFRHVPLLQVPEGGFGHTPVSLHPAKSGPNAPRNVNAEMHLASRCFPLQKF